MSESNPFILRVWYDLSIHFVSRGLEFHHLLYRIVFQFLTDDKGIEYMAFSHETKQKNWQGGLGPQEAPHDKGMYATRDPRCPVASLRELLESTTPGATSLFKEAHASPHAVMKICHAAKPCKKHYFRSISPIFHEILAVHEIICSALSPKHGITGLKWWWVWDPPHYVHEWTQEQGICQNLCKRMIYEQKHRLSSALTKNSLNASSLSQPFVKRC